MSSIGPSMRAVTAGSTSRNSPLRTPRSMMPVTRRQNALDDFTAIEACEIGKVADSSA